MIQKLGVWLVGVAAAGLVGSVVTAVTPEKGRKTVEFACGLLVVFLILLPVRSLSGFSLPDVLADYEAALSQRIESVGVGVEENAEGGGFCIPPL